MVNGMKNSQDKIDFVIIWVDGNDPKWQKEKNKYDSSADSDNRIIRYRDWGLLKYWFRGVEKFAPWVNKIHFVTWGHLPEWLDTTNPKLNIVNHKDFIPKEYLPTFSSHVIELNLHRIKGLSEKFVYLNDDTFLISDSPKSYFFKDNKPMDSCALNVHCVKKSIIMQTICNNDVSIINEHFDFKKSMKENWKKWFSLKNGKELLRTIALFGCPRFPGFYQPHLPNSYLKSTFKEVWKQEPDILHSTCLNKFRNVSDVNQWVFREWQLASGNFKVRKSKYGETFYIDRDGLEIKKDILSCIRNQKRRAISINDGDMSEKDFNQLTKDIQDAFESILPDKCSFEK